MDTPAPQIFHGTAIISTLDGVTTVLVAFLFVCLVFPAIVKNRTQFYAALGAIVGILLLHTVALMLNRSEGFVVPMGVFTGLLQIVALILLVLSVGGLTARELASDMSRAYEVIRRGETTKEVVIPIGDQARRDRSESQKVYHVDTPASTSEKDPGIPLS